jgi:hypothetical protein
MSVTAEHLNVTDPAGLIHVGGPAELRWRDHRSTYLLPDGPLFDPRRHRVDHVGHDLARQFCAEHHYLAGAWPAALCCWGLWRDTGDEEILAGVAVFTVPTNVAALTRVFDPQLAEPYRQSCELGRFVLLDEVEHNGESWFLTRVLADASAAGWRGVLAASDPQPLRRGDGTLAFRGHHGGVYGGALGAPHPGAWGATYLGRGTPRTRLVDRDGQVLSARALSKLRRLERGHRYVEARLVSLGAAPRDGREVTDWLPEAINAAGLRRVRNHGVHRFAFALGDRRARRAMAASWVPQPRPVGLDPVA